MKTLDEVIKALELCKGSYCSDSGGDCPYFSECDGRQENQIHDALHYLKEYRSEKGLWESDRKGYEDWIEQYKDAREKHQQAVIELTKNPALTWDELQQMEGKPVWVEFLVYNIDNVARWMMVARETDAQSIPLSWNEDGAFRWMYAHEENMGRIWQAYRKEHHDNVG